MWWDNEIPERLSKSVTHVKGASVLTYDQIHNHVKGVNNYEE